MVNEPLFIHQNVLYVSLYDQNMCKDNMVTYYSFQTTFIFRKIKLIPEVEIYSKNLEAS
jgi:hypothetical protein